MRKIYTLLACAIVAASCFFAAPQLKHYFKPSEESEENEEYDGPAERDSLEAAKTIDPSLGYVPVERLGDAIDFTERSKRARISSGASNMRTAAFAMSWQERGPVYDTIGPSNGNSRAGVNYTSGRISAVLVDTLNDPSGNTVFAAGVAGGLWKCTNFLSTTEWPNWHPINDYLANLAIYSITQDPSHPNTMYFATGEATSNADAVYGNGIWKSTDAGSTWTHLNSTSLFRRSFKIISDKNGVLYLAARVLTAPIEQPYGLLRSSDGGTTWQNITPAGLSGTTNGTCTDIELSSTGRLHASFGYLGSSVFHRYTDNPATVTTAGWSAGTGLRLSATAALRMEIAVQGNVAYAVTVNSSYNTDSTYRSLDGGATWTKQNTTVMPTGLGNAQGWYDLTLGINPLNSNELLSGGLDAYRSVNGGATWTRATFWITSVPYVHADHHFMQWWNVNGENRVIIGSDGGIFLSRDNGVTFKDKNRNLGIKQFYAGAIHPDAGSPYLLAGAQDNGTHQIKYAGLSPSIEVTGGDGCFVHINQKNPSIQFGSYVYNQYRRSTNGGQTWSQVNWSSSAGLFVNPFDYDDDNNIFYAPWSGTSLFRWPNANTGTTGAVALPMPGTGYGLTAIKVSTNTAKRIYMGTNTGRVFRLNNADVASTASLATDFKDISGPSFPAAGYVNCINTGSNDNYLVAVFTNYGVNNVWYSTNGGDTWSAIDGNLPDMPVRWAMFHPQYNNRLIIATETGIYTTDAVNGANTVWTADASFPTVRTDMLQMRNSDHTIVAATHGRGLYTAQLQLASGPEVNFVTDATPVTENAAAMEGCRGYKDYEVQVALSSAASTATNVTINAGGTATRNVDYAITTNGSFTAPSDALTFDAGSTAPKTVTVRVYDDAEVESTEQIQLSFTIAGSNAIPGTVDMHTITVKDNDYAPVATPAVQTYSVGSFNSTIIATSPFASNKFKHRMQSLYTAAELRAAGLTRGGDIKSLTVRVMAKNSTKPFAGLNIAMANVSNTALTNFNTTATYTTVYSGDYTTAVGDNTFAFNTPFHWDGTSNVVVQFCFDNGTATPDAAADYLEGNSYPLGLGVRASAYSNYTTGAVSGCALPAAFISDFRMNMSFGVDFGINPIAIALNTTRTEYLNANNDLYYYTDGQVIARVRNLSGHNYACTQMSIDRAGTGATRFWNANKKNFLMDKAYQLTADNNNAKGSYEVTLYFTAAEKAGWEAATGNSWNDIQLVKTSGAIKDVTPSNAKPNNNGTVQEVVNTVKGTYAGGYTLTGVFTTGMGGIGAGTPGREFNSLLVTASKQNGSAARGLPGTGNGIDVQWTTSFENGSSHFIVEKSTDGINYHSIAIVPASGNTIAATSYSYIDNDVQPYNFYKISLVYSDNTMIANKASLILGDPNTKQQLFVLTNPFRDDIRLRFARIPTSNVALSLYDMQGRKVAQYEAAPTDIIFFNVATQNIIGKGVYYLEAITDGQRFSTKVLKQ